MRARQHDFLIIHVNSYCTLKYRKVFVFVCTIKNMKSKFFIIKKVFHHIILYSPSFFTRLLSTFVNDFMRRKRDEKCMKAKRCLMQNMLCWIADSCADECSDLKATAKPNGPQSWWKMKSQKWGEKIEQIAIFVHSPVEKFRCNNFNERRWSAFLTL